MGVGFGGWERKTAEAPAGGGGFGSACLSDQRVRSGDGVDRVGHARRVLADRVDGSLDETTGGLGGDTEILADLTVRTLAAITEAETTIVLPSSRLAIRQPDGCIDVLKQGEA